MARLAGEVVGICVGVPIATISLTLAIPAEAVKAAMESGCETYQEIKDYFDENY